MSHFTVMVIGQEPEKQLDPFYEGLETPRYVEYTKQQLIDKERSKILEFKDSIYQKFLSDPSAYKANCTNENHINYLENKFPLKLEWSDEQLYASAVEYYEQEEIGPDGEVYSERNPKSKWDWHQLGGRWAGRFLVKDGVEFNAPNFSWWWDEADKLEVLAERRTDSAKKCDIANLSEISTFAILMNGEWHENGEMGWFGISHGEKMTDEEWKSKQQELLASLPDDELISIYDCHI